MAIMGAAADRDRSGLVEQQPITAQNSSERLAVAMEQLKKKSSEIRNNAVAPIGLPPVQSQGGSGGYRVLGVAANVDYTQPRVRQRTPTPHWRRHGEGRPGETVA
jgi:hypothetical protein